MGKRLRNFCQEIASNHILSISSSVPHIQPTFIFYLEKIKLALLSFLCRIWYVPRSCLALPQCGGPPLPITITCHPCPLWWRSGSGHVILDIFFDSLKTMILKAEKNQWMLPLKSWVDISGKKGKICFLGNWIKWSTKKSILD